MELLDLKHTEIETVEKDNWDSDMSSGPPTQ